MELRLRRTGRNEPSLDVKRSLEKIDPQKIPEYNSSDDPDAHNLDVYSSLGPDSPNLEQVVEDKEARPYVDPMPKRTTISSDGREDHVARMRESTPSSTPDEIKDLQKTFSLVYDTPIRITRVTLLPYTSKEVRLVRFICQKSKKMKPDGKLRPDRLYQAWVYQAEPSTARKEMVLYYLGSKHGVPTPSPVGYIPHLKEQNYPYKAAILGGGIVEHAGRPYSQHIFDLALPELLHRTAVNVSRLIASMHVRMTFLKPQIQAFDVNLNVIKPGDQITSLYSAALNLQVNNPILTKLSQLFNVLYVKQTSPIIIGHRDLHTGNLVTSSMGGSESLAEYAFIDWGDAGERRWGGDLLDFFVHHKREAVKANPQYEKYYSLEPIDAYVRKFNEEADNFGLEERVSFSRLSQADMRNLLIDSLTINAFEMIDPMRRNIGDIMNKAIYHGKRIIKDLDSLSSYGCREIAQEILLFYRCLFEYLSRRKEGPGIHNYGYMVDVFGKIGLRRGPGYTFLPQIFRHES